MNKDVEEILRQSDDDGETAAPDVEDEEEETAAPEDDEDREETARAELDAEEGDTGDINALRRKGKATISLEEVRTLQARARARGRRVGKVVATKQKAKKAAAPAAPPNLVKPGEAGRQLIDKWKRTDRPFTIRHEGHYYYVAEIRFTCQGDSNRAFLKVNKDEPILFFDKAVGDETTFLGNHAKVNLRQTNFQRPSKNTYVASDFLIQSINMEVAGLRVKYDEAAVNAVPALISAHDVLLGRGWVWDDSGIALPKEIFHDWTRENLLYQALRSSSVLFFNWAKNQAGGNARTTTELIDTLQKIPDVTVRRLSRTSGGASALKVRDGYVFTDDPERSEYGQFTAKLVIQDDIVFPIKPIDLGGGSAVKPIEVGLYVQLSMNGVAFEPAARRSA